MIAASSPGNAAALIQALRVMLEVSCKAAGLPRSTRSLTPSSWTPPPLRPGAQVAPLVRVPDSPLPEASDATVALGQSGRRRGRRVGPEIAGGVDRADPVGVARRSVAAGVGEGRPRGLG